MKITKDSRKFSLIENVRNYPALYKYSSDDYKDGLVRNNCWKQVSKAVGLSAAECKSAWDILRSNYRREKRKLSTILNGTKKIKWAFYEVMTFLDDDPQVNTTSNFESQPNARNETETSDCATTTPVEDPKSAGAGREISILSSSDESDLPISRPRKKKKTKTGGTDRSVVTTGGNSQKLFDAACSLSSSVSSALANSSQNFSQPKSDCTAYGEHVGMTLERLESPARDVAIFKISEILYLAKTGQLDCNNV